MHRSTPSVKELTEGLGKRKSILHQESITTPVKRGSISIAKASPNSPANKSLNESKQLEEEKEGEGSYMDSRQRLDVSHPEEEKEMEQEEEEEEEDEDEEEEEAFKTSIDLINLFLAILFITGVLLENPMHKAYSLYEAINDMFQQNDSNYDDISTKEDLTDFMSQVLLPQLYNDAENPSNLNLSPEQRENGTSHFYTHWNFFCGMQISIRRTLLGPNQDQLTKNVIERKREGIYQSAKSKYTEEDTRTYGNFSHSSSGGYRDAGGYLIYFPTEWTYEEAKNKLEEIQNNNILDEGFLSLTYELIFYNANDETTLYLANWFVMQNSGILRRGEETVGFFPQAYDSYHETDMRVIIGFLIQICYILCFIYSMIKMFKMIYGHATELFTRGKLDAPWYDYLDIVVLSLCLTSVIFWLKLIALKMDMFELPFSNSDFNYWVGHARDTLPYIRVSGLAIAFLGLRMVQTLNAAFPAFGILFDTLRKAKTDIFFFLCMMLTMMFGYVITSHCLFGYRERSFHTIGESSLKLFEFLLGEIDYDIMKDSNYDMSLVIFIPFMLLFFFILLNMFMAILMSIYGDLRVKKQRDTEAIAALLSQAAGKLRNKWMNLLTCAPPSHIKVITNQKADEDNSEILQELEGDEDEGKKGPSFYENFCFNLSQICGKTKVLKTKEEFERDKNNMIHYIQTQKKLAKKERIEQEKDTNTQFELFAQALLYLIFITVFVLMLSNQLNITDADKTAQSVNSILSLGGELDFEEDVGHIDDAQPFLENLVSSSFYENYVNPSTEGKNDQSDQTQIIFFLNPLIRLTYRWFELIDNSNPKTRGVIPKIRSDKKISETSSRISEEYSSDYSINGRTYKYSSGDHTANDKGGFSVLLNYNLNDTERIMKEVREDHMINIHTGLVVVESVSYCPNNGLYSYNAVTLTFSANGKVKVDITVRAFMMKLYHGARSFRVILEVLYLIFIIYYVSIELIDWCGKWMDYTREHYEKLRKSKPSDGHCVKFLLFMEINPDGFGEQSAIMCLVLVIIAFIQMILRWILRFLMTTFAYLTKDFFNFLDFCSLTMSIILIFTWIDLISTAISSDYRPEEYENTLTIYAERSSTFVTYAWISSINNLIIFFRILQYYKFSKKLSMLATVLDSGAKDIFFFFLMFALILFGFIVMGHLIFGKSLEAYSTIFNSLAAIFTIIIGDISADDLRKSDPQMAVLFYIILIILFFLILLNMFIAIIGAHHEEVSAEESEDPEEDGKGKELEANVLKKIVYILKTKLYLVSQIVLDKEVMQQSREDALIPHLLLRFSVLKPGDEYEEEEDESANEKPNEEEKENTNVPIDISNPFYDDQKLIEGMKPHVLMRVTEMDDSRLVTGEDDQKGPMSLHIFNAKLDDGKLTDFDKSNPNMWSFMLEKILTRTSKNSILFSELYYKSHGQYISIPKKPDIRELSPLAGQFIMLNPSDKLRINAWRNASIDQKWKYWEGMDIEYYGLSGRLAELEFEGEEYMSILSSKLTERVETEEAKKDNQLEFRRARSPSLDYASSIVVDKSKIDHSPNAMPIKTAHQMEDIITEESLNEEKVKRMRDIFEHERHAGIATSDSENDPMASVLTVKRMLASRYYNFQAFNSVSDISVNYWKMSTHEEQYYLWFHKFNNKERVKLWNSLKFSKDHFKKLVKDKNKIRSNEKVKYEGEDEENWEKKKKESKKERIQRINIETTSSLNAIDNLGHTTENILFLWNCCITQSRDPNFAHLKGLSAEFIQNMIYGDYSFVKKENGSNLDKEKIHKRIRVFYGELEERLQFWLPLSMPDKLEMLMNQNNISEAEIMISLIAVEEPRSGDMRMFDVTLERELDTRVFRKCILLSQLEAQKYTLDLQLSRLLNLEKEDSNLYDFIQKMTSNINHFRKQGDILARDMRNRQRIKAKKDKKQG